MSARLAVLSTTPVLSTTLTTDVPCTFYCSALPFVILLQVTALCSDPLSSIGPHAFLEEQAGTRLRDSSVSSASLSQGKNSTGVTTATNGDFTASSSGKSVVQRVGSVRRSLKSLGAQIVFKPQVVPGDEDLSVVGRAAPVSSTNTPAPPAVPGSIGGTGYLPEDLGEDAFASLQVGVAPQSSAISRSTKHFYDRLDA